MQEAAQATRHIDPCSSVTCRCGNYAPCRLSTSASPGDAPPLAAHFAEVIQPQATSIGQILQGLPLTILPEAIDASALFEIHGDGSGATPRALPSTALNAISAFIDPISELSGDAVDMLDTLSDIAETEGHGSSADLLLQQIHGFPHQERTLPQLVKFTEELFGLRQAIVALMAPVQFKRNRRWSQEEWQSWTTDQIFDKTMMNDAINVWRDTIFVRHIRETTKKKLEEVPLGRGHHSACRVITRNAFRAWQQQEYGTAALSKIFLKFPRSDIRGVLQEWQAYADTQKYKEQRLRHLPKDDPIRAAVAGPAPLPSKSSEPNVEGIASGSSQPSTRFVNENALRYASQSMSEYFRQFEAEHQPTPEVSVAGPASTTAPPPWGRGSVLHRKLQHLRELRRTVLRGTASPETQRWFDSKDLDRQLEKLTRLN